MTKSYQKNAHLRFGNTRLQSVVEKLGLYDTYMMDDFVLEKDQVFLLRAGDNGEEIFLYFNEKLKEAERDAVVSKVIIAGEYRGLRIKMQGLYRLQVSEGDAIELELL